MRTAIVHRHRGSVLGAIHQDGHVENAACERLGFDFVAFMTGEHADGVTVDADAIVSAKSVLRGSGDRRDA